MEQFDFFLPNYYIHKTWLYIYKCRESLLILIINYVFFMAIKNFSDSVLNISYQAGYIDHDT